MSETTKKTCGFCGNTNHVLTDPIVAVKDGEYKSWPICLDCERGVPLPQVLAKMFGLTAAGLSTREIRIRSFYQVTTPIESGVTS